MAIDLKRKVKKWQGGFSLPELVVTIGIIVLITATILVSYSDFNSSVLLSSQAFEIALDVREAQVFGLSVKGEGGSDSFREEYGLYFDVTTVVNQGRYIFFQDDGTIDPARYDNGVDVVLSTFLLDPRHQISLLCSAEPAADGTCPGTELDYLTVSFKRPNFDARFHSSPVVSGMNEVFITVSVTGADSNSRTVRVTNTGQIEVI